MASTESHVMNQSSNQADQAVKNSQLPSKKFSSSFFESESSTIFIKTVKSDVKEDRASIFRLYCIAGNKVEVEVPKMQSYSSNNCPAFAAAYMVDLCDQRFVFGALYVDSQSQRNWAVHVLETGVLLPCPWLTFKPTRLAETNPPEPKSFYSE